MALPKIDLPLFEMKLPSSGEMIKYRPFTVKEEKILLIAQEADDPTQEVMAVKQIVNNCLPDIEVDELAMFDLEYIMLVLRSRSVDNTVDFSITDPDTEENVKLTLDIEDVIVKTIDGHTNEISINDEFMLYLKYPTINEFLKIMKLDASDPLVNYFMMISCLDKIASEDEVHFFKDYSDEETDAFVENFSSQVVKGIQIFFETMPKLRHEIKYTNKNKDEKTFVVEGMRSFFI